MVEDVQISHKITGLLSEQSRVEDYLFWGGGTKIVNEYDLCVRLTQENVLNFPLYHLYKMQRPD